MKSARLPLAEHALVLLGFLVISLAATWPLAAHMDNAVLGPPGDAYEYLYKIAWFKTTLLDGGGNPLFNPNVFYPVGYDVSLSETTLANMTLALPFAAVWGEVVAYNVVVLLTFVLSGWAMYWLVCYLTGSTAGGVVAGLIWAFSAYRMGHLGAGHLPLLGTQWIPLVLLFAERALQMRRWTYAALAALFFGLTALSSWYYAYLVGLFLVVFLVVRWLRLRSELSLRKAAGLLSVFVVVAVVVALPTALPLLRNVGAGATQYDDLQYVDLWSGRVADFFWPSPFHPLWGQAAASVHIPNVLDGTLYLGYAGVALAIVGLWKAKVPGKRAYVWMAAFGFVMALGVTLHVAAGAVRTHLPQPLESAVMGTMHFLTTKAALNKLAFSNLLTADGMAIPMPAVLLYLFFPFFTAMRVPARFELGIILAIAVLGGAGVAYLVQRGKTKAGRALIGVGFGLFVAFDLASAPFALGYSEARPQPVDAWLAAQPNPSPVVQLPLERTWYGYPLYQQRFHGQPIAYGYGTFVPLDFRPAETILRQFPEDGAMEWLKQAGVKILLLAQDSFGATWPEVKQTMDAQSDWAFVGTFADQPLFHDGGLMALVPPTPVVPPSEWVTGAKRGYIQDTIWVYKFVGQGGQ